MRAFAPHGHWRTLTFLGALRNNRLTASCVFDGPINGECFLAYRGGLGTLLRNSRSNDGAVGDRLVSGVSTVARFGLIVVAVDVTTGREDVYYSANMTIKVMASSAFPSKQAAFSPNGHYAT